MLKECYEQELCALWNYYDIYIMDLTILKLATLIMPTSCPINLINIFSHPSHTTQVFNLIVYNLIIDCVSKFGLPISTLLNRHHSGTYYPLFGNQNENILER